MPIVITAQNSFHGRTLATITATGQPKYQRGFEPLMPGFRYVPYNDVTALERAVAELVQVQHSWWRRVRGAPRMGLAAIMLEALQGEGGVRPGDPAFFAAVRRVCDETGALLVMDEVQVGMGRTGKLFGFENLSIEPDVFTLAKGLGGGIPIGAMVCSARLRDVLQPGEHASTFGGNPLACRAGLVVTHALTEDKVLDNVRIRGAQLRDALESLVAAYPDAARETRGWGLIQGLELREPRAPQFVQAALGEGLLLVPAGPNVSSLRAAINDHRARTGPSDTGNTTSLPEPLRLGFTHHLRPLHGHQGVDSRSCSERPRETRGPDAPGDSARTQCTPQTTMRSSEFPILGAQRGDFSFQSRENPLFDEDALVMISLRSCTPIKYLQDTSLTIHTMVLHEELHGRTK
ncbi:hypothetical protein F1559_000761 [Cyanidiococcus yangmingshanensis]|uniref:Acetylornithine aminotransferase n=1 Tax=Cyanidiococcus yangmingshanensis TaxID=2690220 RepID=A0A7J7IQW4_9RHOD|nr:hypothetical protein F1559_000761 [Cyanidiococcus yangmingshanensis]